MAYETGTAANHVDLWDKLIAFLTTDAELVALNQAWSVAWEAGSGDPNPTDIVLRGPGLSNQDDIYIALRRVDTNIASDVSTYYLRGCTGVVPTASAYNLHVNMTPAAVKMFVRNAPMDYWFVASGRRFIVVVQVGTVYETMYGGFFLPYADPTTYTYPMFIGGTCGSGGPNESTHWNSVSDDHTAFMYANYNSNATGWNSSAWMLDPAGNWLRCSVNTEAAPCSLGPRYFGGGQGLGASLSQGSSGGYYGYNGIRTREGRGYGVDYAMTPITLVQATTSDQTFGVLDGVYSVPGRGQLIENIIQADNAVHVVFQNAFRTSLGDWFAVTLTPEDSNSQFILTEESNS